MTIATLTTPSIRDALTSARQRLSASSGTPLLDADVLLAHTLNKDRSYLLTWPERKLSAEQDSIFNQLIERRMAGEPVAYLTGTREFWSLPLNVSTATLIPRPETELLVELALQHIQKGKPLRIADLGTGTGAIALALAYERPLCHITACDLSINALTVAQQNAERLEITNIEFIKSDWYEGLGNNVFDIIVANPPYVRARDACLQQGDLRFEPQTALVAGPSGMEAVDPIIEGAKRHLNSKGWLLFEHGFDQGPASMALMEKHQYKNIECIKDYTGHDRVTLGQFKG